MNQFLKYKLLKIPIIVWVLQLLYVAVCLAIFFVIVKTTAQIGIRVAFIAIVVIVNIMWRLAIQRKLPGWF